MNEIYRVLKPQGLFSLALLPAITSRAPFSRIYHINYLTGDHFPVY